MLRSFIFYRPLMQLGAIFGGIVLYALSIALTTVLIIPGADNVQLRPGVAIPIIFGVFFGPVAGFITGFAGNLAADTALNWGWWPYWYLGNGLIGLTSGLFRPTRPNYTRFTTVLAVVGRAAVGITLGMGIASLSERWVSQASWDEIVWVNFTPAWLSNLLNAALLVPIILLLYGVLRETNASAITS